jgi:4-hydroxybenzoate polyprenyltransferase
MRIDKPIGTWLLFLPCSWSILLSQGTPIDTIGTLALFAGGSFLLRAAGCIINDLWDKDFDKQVERTKNRPLAAGIISPFHALICLSIMLSCGLLVLLQFNGYTIMLGASSIVLVILYPLMKRITNWPQLVLGFCFNYGVLMGQSSILGLNTLPIGVLYLGAVSWTLMYDTVYALQDLEDDLKAGVKSTAVLLRENIKNWLVLFSTITTTCFALTGYLINASLPFYLGVAGVAMHFIWQLVNLNIKLTSSCWAIFCSNKYLGIIFSFGCLLEYLIHYFT